ncbi:MAG: hypothetical protein VXU46_06605 [Planctomycetota bacterium]|nr:hypothetical protein [Planctomycetota bacterium]
MEGHSATWFLKIANFNRLSGLAADRCGSEYLPKIFGLEYVLRD